jgi:hypothetical protein
VALAALVISFTSVLAIRFVKDYVEVNVWTQIWRQLLAASFMILLGWFLIDFMSRGMKHLLTGGVLIGIVYLAGLAVFGFQKLQNEIKSLT